MKPASVEVGLLLFSAVHVPPGIYPLPIAQDKDVGDPAGAEQDAKWQGRRVKGKGDRQRGFYATAFTYRITGTAIVFLLYSLPSSSQS